MNIDSVNDAIVNIPVPVRDFSMDPYMMVIRSFDVNKPGADIDELKGGVAGGSILHGMLKMGDEIEIRPGIVTRDDKGNLRCTPIFSRIVSLNSEANDLKYAVPGGLIGVGTRIDPTLCRADRLVGFVLGLRGRSPDIYGQIEVNFYLLRRLLGVADGKQRKVEKLAKNEILMVNIGSTSTGAKVAAIKRDAAKLVLTSPACTNIGGKYCDRVRKLLISTMAGSIVYIPLYTILTIRQILTQSCTNRENRTQSTYRKTLASHWLGNYHGWRHH